MVLNVSKCATCRTLGVSPYEKFQIDGLTFYVDNDGKIHDVDMNEELASIDAVYSILTHTEAVIYTNDRLTSGEYDICKLLHAKYATMDDSPVFNDEYFVDLWDVEPYEDEGRFTDGTDNCDHVLATIQRKYFPSMRKGDMVKIQ